ncbi:hypothetical protein ACOSP7_017385 [Xanthoceras sorbifolium]
MEEDASSMVYNAKRNVMAETSDSNNSNFSLRPTKRIRHENGSLSLAKFKGVVPQQNGRWGAQIYANHQRIWLGTFKSEKEAAMAYDSAAIKIRSGDTHRNMPWTDQNNQEPVFQNQYTTEAVLNMIRDGSYQPKFVDFLRTQSQKEDNNNTTASCTSLDKIMVHGEEHYSCKQLFQKELTPSDVGKLNRLVIPKKYAVKYFPYICENAEEQNNNDNGNNNCGGVDDMELVFYDKLMRTWKFRYCFWRSSQSFVFTRGWNRFVKEKKLKEKDIVSFYNCECAKLGREAKLEGHHNHQSFFLIDVITQSDEKSCVLERVDLGLGQSLERVLRYKEEIKDDEKEFNEEEKLTAAAVADDKGVWLFGVKIN